METLTMAETRTCPSCGETLKEGYPDGLCPRCFLKTGIAAKRDAPAPAGTPALPRYDILQEDATGLYRARDKETEKIVALQVVSGPGPEFRARAERLAKLDHPSLPRLHDFGNATGVNYLAYDYAEGRALSDVRLQPREALRVVEQVCAALGYAHDQGVPLGKVSPQSIRIDAQGQARLAEFDLNLTGLDLEAVAASIHAALTGSSPAAPRAEREAKPTGPDPHGGVLLAIAIAGGVILLAGFLTWFDASFEFQGKAMTATTNGWETSVQYNGDTLLPTWIAIVLGAVTGILALLHRQRMIAISWKVLVGMAAAGATMVLTWLIFYANSDVPQGTRLSLGIGPILALLAFSSSAAAALQMRPKPERAPRKKKPQPMPPAARKRRAAARKRRRS